LSIPIVFLGILLAKTVSYILQSNFEISYLEYVSLELKRDFFPFLIIFVLVNIPSLFFNKDSKIED